MSRSRFHHRKTEFKSNTEQKKKSAILFVIVFNPFATNVNSNLNLDLEATAGAATARSLELASLRAHVRPEKHEGLRLTRELPVNCCSSEICGKYNRSAVVVEIPNKFCIILFRDTGANIVSGRRRHHMCFECKESLFTVVAETTKLPGPRKPSFEHGRVASLIFRKWVSGSGGRGGGRGAGSDSFSGGSFCQPADRIAVNPAQDKAMTSASAQRNTGTLLRTRQCENSMSFSRQRTHYRRTPTARSVTDSFDDLSRLSQQTRLFCHRPGNWGTARTKLAQCFQVFQAVSEPG